MSPSLFGVLRSSTSSNRVYRIGSGAGFSGDRVDAAQSVVAAGVIIAMAKSEGLENVRVAVLEGDDLSGTVDIAETERWEGDRHLPTPYGDVVPINAYIGARPIAEAIRAGAQIVVSGRVADPALALGPLVAHFNWDWDDLDLIAAGTLAGHLLECGSQVSGGFFADPGYKDVPDPANIGFPIAEVEADGTFVLTKAEGTGGCIDTRTVKEQLLYEIHDPSAYMTPDVTLDLTEVEVTVIARDRVRVSGSRGHTAPEKLKATVGYDGDWLGEAEISYAGPNAFRRAQLAVSIIRERLARRGLDVACRADVIGTVSVFDDDRASMLADFQAQSDGDYRVRFAFGGEGPAVEAAAQEVNALYCCGPAGGGVRQSVRQRVRTVSHLVSRSLVSVSHTFIGDAA